MKVKKLSIAISILSIFILLMLPSSIFAGSLNDITQDINSQLKSESIDRENYKLTTSETVNGVEKQKYIILFKNAVDEEALANANADISYIYTCIPAASILIPEDKIDELKNNPNVVSLEPDNIVQVETQTIDWGITKTNAQSAWNSGYTGQGVKIAIIDTGIDIDHPDLNVAGGVSYVSYTSDYPYGYEYDDDDGHGTHVAGIIAAQNNTRGNVGIAPGASVYAVKVLDFNGDGLISDIVAGIDWAVSHDMDIINLSLGSTTNDSTLEAVVNEAYNQGILVVAAAGNSGNSSGTGDNIAYPARYDSVIAVGATNIDNIRAEFSCTGPTLEIAAPGVNIYSTYFTGSYLTASGTSMACPYVVGNLALLKQANPTYTNVQLRALLQQSAIDLGSAGRDSKYGYGLIQAPTHASMQYCSISFNSQGGSAITSILVDKNSKITAPSNPTKTDYKFCGWYKEPECINIWNFDTDIVTSNITLYAQWSYYFSGEGTESNPFLITNTDDLKQLAALANQGNIIYGSKYYRMETDIDISGSNWTPIGNDSHNFYGCFDGNGHKITGMQIVFNISGGTVDSFGLFGVNLGTIKNLSIINSNINITSDNDRIGGIAGLNKGQIINCNNAGNVTISGTSAGYGQAAGGIVGENSLNSKIINCYNTGSITGLYQVGGIAGKNVGSINNCYNTGTINGVTYSSVNTGGIAGFNVTDDAVIDNCYNTGTINGIHFSGGIAGENYDNAIVTNCYNLGTINDNNYSGGIAGYNYWSAIISKCHNTGVVNGSNNAGGIAGFNSSAKISDCYNASELNSGSYTGGITGYNNSGAIERCYNYASIAGSTRAGGIVGYNHGSNANISYCYNLSTITGSYSGGIVGQNYYYSNTSNCFNTGNINGSYAGGIAGDNDTNASVNDCYNTASVSGSTSITYTGGVIGKNTGIVNNCYNIGAISGTYPGGIAGYNSNSISYCYFLNNILKGIGTGNGTATTYSCTLAQMQQQSTFTGFDFTNNWVIPGSNSTPYLRAFYIPVSGIILNDSADSLLIGESVTLSADIQPINATNKNITWSSSNTNIATVSDAGLVNGISKGAVTITATTDDGNLIAQRTLEIIQPVTGISLNTSSEELEIGNQLQLTPTVLPANASDTSVTWTSSNTSIATVSNTGLVTAVRSGEAQITVTTSDGEKTAVCDVKVLGMAVTTSPKIIFYKGEPFDTTGGILTIYKPSDVQETVYLIPDMVTGYDNSILGNQTLTVTYGEYTATYDISVNYANVSFDTKGGSAIDSINADYNTIISKPTQPQKTGYAFDGWYADEQLTDLWIFSEDKVTQDTTLYAKWSICSYNVTFDSKGGSEVIGNQVFNSLITAPTEPSKQHYSFAGWFKEDSCTNPWNFDTDTVPGDSFTLYAKWTPDLHTINGLANNSSYGTITGAGQFGYDSQATLTAVPNEKYRFICWTDNGEEVSSNYAYTFTVTGDHTVVAVFDVILTPVLSSAVSAGYNSICLTWSAVDGASGYDIYRSLSSTGTYDKIGASDTTDFTDSNLTPGKYYYYKIKAVYSAGEVKTYSNFSEYLSAKPIPSAPTINVSSYSYTSLQLSWSAIDGANGYQIYRSLSSTGTYSLVATTSLTSYINSGLVTGKNYYYKVIAYTTVGSSKIYGAYSLPMYAKPVPPAPNASCVSAGFNSIKISWASVSGATKYEIYRSPNDIGTYTLIASTTLASYIDKDLAAGLMYYYKVIAYHLEGTVKVYGSYSSSVSAIPVPLAPVAKAQSASYNSINITWNEIVGANWYEVYQIDNQTLNDDLIATISSTSYLHKNLTPGASYSYKIRAYRVSGFGELYSPYSEVTTAVPVPSTPAIKVTLKSYNSLNISWDEIEGADGYEIYRSTSISGSYNFHDTTTALSYDDTSLTTGYTYYYKVKAYHSDNPKIFGNESNIASLKVIPTTPVVSVSPASYNSLSLSWDSVAGATGYRIYRSTSSSGTYASLTTVTSGTSYINSGLATGTTYYYKILAYRTEGTVTTNSAYSAVKYAKVVPATPDGVSAQSASAASIKITWNKVSGASGYTIYRLSSTGTYPSIATVTSSYNYYTNAGLITGTTYYYKVASYRLVGTTKVYGTASEIVSAAPESSLPQAMSLLNPPKITVSPASYNSLIISWDAVDGATGYEISKSTSSTNGFEPIKITDALNYTDNDLITGITYYYKVRALINGDPIVYGDYSAVSGLKPIPATPVITVTPTQYNSLSISWEAVDGATGYKIYRSTSETGTYAYVTAITYGTSYVNTGLATGTTYYYKVLAYRTEGTVTTNSLYSAYKYAKVIPSAPIATAASYNYNSVKISWPKVSGASGYTIYRCATETGTYAALITTSLNSYTNTSLATGSTWYYTVAAYRLLGTTKVYGLKSEATSAAPVPSTPVPTAVSTGYNSIKISWPAVAGASAYEVYSAGESDTFLARVTTPYFTQADLTPGTSYSYKVVAYKTMASGDVYGVYSNIVTASPVPSAPTTSVLLNTYNSLNIKWNEIDGADKYEISRSASSKGIFEPIGESDTTDFIDNSLITGATYYYKVRAFIETDQKVYGDYSAIVSSKALPAAPVVTVTPTAYNSLSLSWNSQDGVTGYRIYRSTSKTGTYALVKTTAETSFINTSLAAGTTYYYKLIAVRTDGAVTTLSPYSAVKYAKVIPAAPTGVSAQSASYNSIKVTWDKVSGASGYTIYRLASNGTYSAIATVTTNSYTNTSLKTGTTYTYKVAAYRLAGTTKVYGGYSEIVSDCPKPAIPAPSAVSAGYNSVYLSWSAISGASGYEVYLTDPQTQTDKQLTSTSSLNYKHSSLITNKQYSYKVRSYTTLGDNTVFGAYSSIISATPIPSTPKISVDLNTINSIKISWEPVGGAEGYEVLRSSTIDGTYEIISTISDTEYVDTGLTLQNSYYYKVRAYITDDADNIYSEYSSPTGRVMLPKTPSLSAASYSYNCIQLTWDSIDGATGYKIYRSTSSSGTYSIIYTITDGSTSYINPGLTSGTAYYYKVKTYTTTPNGEVYSDYSANASARPYVTAPIITTSVPIYNNIRIDWSAVEGASGYQVYRATTLDGTYSLIADTKSSVLNYTNTGLAMDKTYYYKVRAYRTVGTTKVGGFYSDIESNKTRQPLKPELKLLFLTSDEDVMYPDYVGFYVFNNGPVTLTIYSQNALLYDYEYYFYDSALILADEEYVYNYVQFGPSEDGLVSFYTLEWPTRYDEYSKIYFDFKYDGIMYRGYVSNYFGFHYYKK